MIIQIERGQQVMNLVNKEVLHGTFGQGNVVSCDEEYIEVEFDIGMKKFVFPDVFGEFMTLTDKEALALVKAKIEEQEEERQVRAAEIEAERVEEQERLQLLEQQRTMKTTRVHPELQSVFWAKDEDDKAIFTDWKVFVGTIKNGERKGQPRRLARMNGKSGCLITKRESDNPEKKRRILGLFMVQEDFNGTTEDGYIEAHPDYRIELTKEESEKMLFWNYYVNKKFPKRRTWNSGRQRYFDNIWMAQILRDIMKLRENTEEYAYVEAFFKHFCTINRINPDELEESAGALTL